MMKRFLILLVLLSAIPVAAQNYLISFSGSGASLSVSEVIAENLNKGTSLILNGGDVLRLNLVTGTKANADNQTDCLVVYPNPASGIASMKFSPPVSGDAIISITDFTGKTIAIKNFFLDKASQQFRISGLAPGFFLVNVRGRTYHYSTKLLCNKKQKA